MADLAIPNFSIRGRTQSLFFVRIYAPAGHMTLGGGLDGILGPNSVSGKIPSRLIPAWSILIMASEGSRSWDWIRFILTPFISVIYLSSYFVEEFLNQSLFVLSRSARNFPKKRINWL